MLALHRFQKDVAGAGFLAAGRGKMDVVIIGP